MMMTSMVTKMETIRSIFTVEPVIETAPKSVLEVRFILKRDVDDRLSISESLQIIIHDYRLVLQIIKHD